MIFIIACYMVCYVVWKGIKNLHIYNQCNDVLSVMGLKMNLTNNKNKNIELIKKSLIEEKLIVIITKYNSLFYKPHYKSTAFRTNRGILALV